MITGLSATIGVFVLVFIFGGCLLLDRVLTVRKESKKTAEVEEPGKVVETGAVDIKMDRAERWDAHVESISK